MTAPIAIVRTGEVREVKEGDWTITGNNDLIYVRFPKDWGSIKRAIYAPAYTSEQAQAMIAALPREKSVGVSEQTKRLAAKLDEFTERERKGPTCLSESLELSRRIDALEQGKQSPWVGASLYGYCPTCGAPGVSRERRPNGDDQCTNGHVYPSADAKLSARKEPPKP